MANYKWRKIKSVCVFSSVCFSRKIMRPRFRIWISQNFNDWNCQRKVSHLLITSRKMMFIIAIKKKNLSCFLAKNWESEAIGCDATAENKPCSFLSLPFSFSQNVFPLFCDTVPPHPKSPAGGLDTTQTQHIPNTELSTWRIQNTCKHRLFGGWCKLVSANPFPGKSTPGHLFILRRQRNIHAFIKLCFPPADCCERTMWMTAEVFEEKKWLHEHEDAWGQC